MYSHEEESIIDATLDFIDDTLSECGWEVRQWREYNTGLYTLIDTDMDLEIDDSLGLAIERDGTILIYHTDESTYKSKSPIGCDQILYFHLSSPHCFDSIKEALSE